MNFSSAVSRVLIVGKYTLYKRDNVKPLYVINNTKTNTIAFECNNIRTARAWLRNNR